MAVDVLVPPLGTNTDTLLLVAWLKNEGDTVAKDEPLFSVETDKAVLEVEAPASGVLAGVRATAGDEVTVLSVVATIAAPGEAMPASAEKSPSQTPGKSDSGVGKAPDAPAPAAVADQPTAPAPTSPRRSLARPVIAETERPDSRQRLFSSPRARAAAGAAGIDWTRLVGTGPEGAVVERDIQAVAFERSERGVGQTRPFASGPAPGSSADGWSLRSLTADIDATALVDVVATLGGAGIAVRPRHLVAKAVAAALAALPEANASLDHDRVQQWTRVHVGVAVAREYGWEIDIHRDTDRAPLRSLAAQRSSSPGETPDPLAWRTLTVVDWSEMGIAHADFPVGTGEWPEIAIGTLRAPDPGTAGAPKLSVTLLVDQRLLGPLEAATLLRTIVAGIENPLGVLA